MLSVIVPCRPDHGHRDRAWEWCRRRWEAIIADVEILTADSDGQQFSYAQAANRAVAESSGDVLLLSGLELAVDANWVRQAFDMAADGAWVLPTWCHYLQEADSARILSGPVDLNIEPPALTDWSGTTSWGLATIPRAAFDAVNGFDERHLGWGWEDCCFADALQTLWGDPVRLDGNLFHFWHPTSHETTWIQPHCDEQKELFHRYEAAIGDRDAMLALVNE